MFDCHYDLLTYIFMNKDNLEKVRRHFKKIFEGNITGGIFNLFYMSPREMKEELNIDIDEIDIINNLKVVNKIIKEEKIVPDDVEYIYGIEGLDYLKRIDDIDKLYDLGLRSTNIVWNNDNKFGGGAKGDINKGLTPLGIELIKKLVDKRIAIDVSHMNDKTFYDVIDICNILKLNGKEPVVFASHSNARGVCNVKRNLSDDQIIKIKELGGIIGIVSVKPFCIKEDNFNKDYNKYATAYLEHINYIKSLLGGIDNIAVSSDDMTYYESNIEYYRYFNVFKQENMKKNLEELLFNNGFSNTDIEKILYMNFKNKILQRF